MESIKEISIIVDHGEKTINFKGCHDGIYYNAVGSYNPNEFKDTVDDYTMAKTVKGIKSYFTKEEIKNEDRERRTQKFIGWPSNTTFKPIIKNQLICNSDINIDEINREELI